MPICACAWRSAASSTPPNSIGRTWRSAMSNSSKKSNARASAVAARRLRGRPTKRFREGREGRSRRCFGEIVLSPVPRDELTKAFGFAIAEQFGGRPFRLDAALMQEHHAVGDVAGKTHFMGDDQHRAAFLGERAH